TQPILTWQKPLGLQTVGAPASWGQEESPSHRQLPSFGPWVAQCHRSGHWSSLVHFDTRTVPSLQAAAPKSPISRVAYARVRAPMGEVLGVMGEDIRRVLKGKPAVGLPGTRSMRLGS